jgi:hypothetical protein
MLTEALVESFRAGGGFNREPTSVIHTRVPFPPDWSTEIAWPQGRSESANHV